LDESDEDDDRVVFEDGSDEGESGTEDSGASSLGDDTSTKDEDYESGSDYTEYGSEEIDQEEEERRSAESLKGSEVSNEDEEKESDQSELLFKVTHTSSSKVNKSNTETSSKILQITAEQADDEYKSDTSDEEVCTE
jgi:hypothetical protein